MYFRVGIGRGVAGLHDFTFLKNKTLHWIWYYFCKILRLPIFFLQIFLVTWYQNFPVNLFSLFAGLRTMASLNFCDHNSSYSSALAQPNHLQKAVWGKHQLSSSFILTFLHFLLGEWNYIEKNWKSNAQKKRGSKKTILEF